MTIDFFEGEQGPYENWAYGASIADACTGVVEPALVALRDPSSVMWKLDYPAIMTSYYDAAQGCQRPAHVQGYIVVEVWERQVNIGYGGEGAALKERAIRVLEEWLKQ